MNSFELDKIKGKVAVVTGFFNNPDYVLEQTKDHDLCILLGGMTRTGSTVEIQSHVEIAKSLPDKYIYILSYKDMLYADFCGFNPQAFETIEWLAKQYVSASIMFHNFVRYVIVGGAVLPAIKNWEKQKSDMLLAFECDDINWASEYDGRFGYVISSLNYADNISYNQHCCLVGHQDKPIIMNVNERGVQELISDELNNGKT